MKAKASKVIKETKFSEVDNDLNQLHEFILENSSLRILENKRDTKATPFNSIQNDLKSKGKQL